MWLTGPEYVDEHYFSFSQDAENAITHMNGQRIGCRAIRTNWAMRKPPAFGQKDGEYDRHPLYLEIMSTIDRHNCNC